MLTIIDTNATPINHPSRGYAEAAWATNPRISPNWWRENLGLTHSKIVTDGRAETLPPAQFSTGVNMLLCTPATLPAKLPAGVTPLVVANDTKTPADFLIIPTAALTTAEVFTVFVQLEQRVQHGTVQAYGIEDLQLGEATTQRPLHWYLAQAAKAAEQVWQRKKRPSLKIILGACDVLDWGILFTQNTEHKTEAVSTLELAARLGLTVLVTPRAVPTVQASPAALQALVQVAAAEAALHQALQGQWPHRAGLPIFSVLQFLQAQQAPWPTPQVATGWVQVVWPMLQQALQAVPQAPMQAQSLLQAWQGVLPFIPSLAQAAATPLALGALQQLNLPQPWAALTPTLQQVALLNSVAGVAAVVVSGGLAVAPLLPLPELPDVGALLVT